MTRRPKGRKYRNLVARGKVIYYERVIDGKRIQRTLETDDWAEAAAIRDELEGEHLEEITRHREDTFKSWARRYRKEGTAHLATLTRADLAYYFRDDGPLGPLMEKRLEQITDATLRKWWANEIEGREVDGKPSPLSISTGRHYLNKISQVYQFAIGLGVNVENPAPAVRASLQRYSRTKQGRADADHNAQPIERPEHLVEIVKAAREEGLRAYIVVLLALDAGLRLGEVEGLRWSCIHWGASPHDTSRTLLIDRSKPRGGELEGTKSGRARRVALSARLRNAMAEWDLNSGRPDRSELVLPDFDRSNFRHRDWDRIRTAAKVPDATIKQLRDSFASWLLTLGVPLGWISNALGHADVSTTAHHYAKWCGGEEYRAPMIPAEGETPPDLLARVEESLCDSGSVLEAAFTGERPTWLNQPQG